MNLKKCGFLLVFAMVFCFAIPNFASAEVKEIPVLNQKKGYTSLDFNEVFKFKGKEFIASPSMSFTFDIGNKKTPPIYFDLGADADLTAIRVDVASGNNVEVYNPEATFTFYDASKQKIGSSYIKMYKGGSSRKSIGVSKARYVKFEYTSGFGGSADNTIFGLGIDASNFKVETPDVSNVNAIPGVDNVNFTWDLPKGSIDTIHVSTGDKTFGMGSLVKNYNFSGLTPDTEYTFLIQTKKGDDVSKGITKKVKTLPKPKEPMPLVKPPENVFLTPQDKKMVIAWDDVKSPYLQGYNVYVDGKKINDKPLTSSKLIVKNLENDKSYKIQISAVNKENTEGEKSKEHTDKPSSDALEVEYDVKMPFGLKDVIDVAMMLLLIVAPLTLLGLAFIYYKPIVTFLYNSIQKKK
ncbi:MULTISPECIES: fibronectin type III domain-containing protein [Bacillus cereus group]|uniref:fibronectin type III domain-containing protein n=1 Tax=Bacillus cereus group TaxID=86661 RepID=UPI00123AA1D2|nr:fibronectin type III domain-containing protein [Bacillus cereus]KAA6456302.1 fibronectin type III domain-containing protein [Bacillus cereus]KAB2417257.1 fibronectin type III domain-containing protein [Bacillus cereus]KAB2437385.1 fibronectin type III domain-containing protein [Bacillus cereus]KAB2468100.1 fibronectin type III domain-containing protein [Bacillus cereus]